MVLSAASLAPAASSQGFSAARTGPSRVPACSMAPTKSPFLALASTRETDTGVDSAAVHEALARVRAELDAVRGLKTKLTTIGTAAKSVNAGLDQLRDGIVARIAEAEAELEPESGA